MQENLRLLNVFLKRNELESSDKRQKNSVTNVAMNPLYYSKSTLLARDDRFQVSEGFKIRKGVEKKGIVTLLHWNNNQLPASNEMNNL